FLLSAYCLLPTAFCLLPSAYCLLPTAFCLLLSACQLLHQINCCCSRVATRQFATRALHAGNPLRLVYQRQNLTRQSRAAKILLENHSRSPAVFQCFGVLPLMIIRSQRKRNHNGGFAGSN